MAAPAPFPPAPPRALDETGRPRLGAYTGSLDEVDLAPLAGRGVRGLWRLARARKRWHHALLATDEVVAALAVVDGGLFSGAFAWAVDRASGAKLFDRSFVGLPGAAHVGDRPADGARASYGGPGGAVRVERRADRWQVQAELGEGLRLEAWLDPAGAPAPFTLVGPVRGGGVSVTQKCGALPVVGVLEAGGRRLDLDGGLATLDYTHGLLARETRWRWASAAGRSADGAPLALNLVEGLAADGGAREDVLFAGAGPSPLPPCTFTLREDPLAPWELRGGDGAVALRFEGLAAHREERDLGLLRTRFVQVAGTFDGVVPGPRGPVRVQGLPGVVEDQSVRW